MTDPARSAMPVHTSTRYAVIRPTVQPGQEQRPTEVVAIHAWHGDRAYALVSKVTDHPELGTLYGPPEWIGYGSLIALAPNLGRAREMQRGMT